MAFRTFPVIWTSWLWPGRASTTEDNWLHSLERDRIHCRQASAQIQQRPLPRPGRRAGHRDGVGGWGWQRHQKQWLARSALIQCSKADFLWWMDFTSQHADSSSWRRRHLGRPKSSHAVAVVKSPLARRNHRAGGPIGPADASTQHIWVFSFHP